MRLPGFESQPETGRPASCYFDNAVASDWRVVVYSASEKGAEVGSDGLKLTSTPEASAAAPLSQVLKWTTGSWDWMLLLSTF